MLNVVSGLILLALLVLPAMASSEETGQPRRKIANTLFKISREHEEQLAPILVRRQVELRGVLDDKARSVANKESAIRKIVESYKAQVVAIQKMTTRLIVEALVANNGGEVK